ncbi:hypothetical protein C4H11_00130 [Bacteroides zoogleoformans]|uniref:Uncharacterized protein n=1 Tax=Bacteroides zoogleoformans TaxID=28119 RepID=A0ABN5IG01_9BACE|nr:hypothetical protein C4H11_00130 [Bacteroides zoogleoformans]
MQDQEKNLYTKTRVLQLTHINLHLLLESTQTKNEKKLRTSYGDDVLKKIVSLHRFQLWIKKTTTI